MVPKDRKAEDECQQVECQKQHAGLLPLPIGADVGHLAVNARNVQPCAAPGLLSLLFAAQHTLSLPQAPQLGLSGCGAAIRWPVDSVRKSFNPKSAPADKPIFGAWSS
jgi:hypothetical protein